MGECNEPFHMNWIVLDDFSCSITSAFSDGDISGACEHSDLSISKHIDRSSPELALATCNLTKFNQGTIHICNQNATSNINTIVLECIFRDLRCLTYELSGQDTSTDSLTLSYQLVEWHYTFLDAASQSGKGRIVKRWDIAKNSGS